jgi:HipA-like kinase
MVMHTGTPTGAPRAWVGTHLAQWLGLPTFEISLINVTPEDEIQFLNGQLAQPGPAFIAREQSGMVWGGAGGILDNLVNPEDVAILALFDTWTRNCDRYSPDLAARRPNRNNVFFSNEDVRDGFFRLIAMDHTHCFNCGREALVKQVCNRAQYVADTFGPALAALIN